MLDSLEVDYKRENDFPTNERYASAEPEDVNPMLGMIFTSLQLGPSLSYFYCMLHSVAEKHAEQKESFLRACTLARRHADFFCKYVQRMKNHFYDDQDSETAAAMTPSYKDAAHWRARNPKTSIRSKISITIPS